LLIFTLLNYALAITGIVLLFVYFTLVSTQLENTCNLNSQWNSMRFTGQSWFDHCVRGFESRFAAVHGHFTVSTHL